MNVSSNQNTYRVSNPPVRELDDQWLIARSCSPVFDMIRQRRFVTKHLARILSVSSRHGDDAR